MNHPRERIDWPRVILELRSAGVTLEDIAQELNRPLSTVANWSYRGSEPRYDDGRALLDLHRRHTAKAG